MTALFLRRLLLVMASPARFVSSHYCFTLVISDSQRDGPETRVKLLIETSSCGMATRRRRQKRTDSKKLLHKKLVVCYR